MLAACYIVKRWHTTCKNNVFCVSEGLISLLSCLVHIINETRSHYTREFNCHKRLFQVCSSVDALLSFRDMVVRVCSLRSPKCIWLPTNTRKICNLHVQLYTHNEHESVFRAKHPDELNTRSADHSSHPDQSERVSKCYGHISSNLMLQTGTSGVYDGLFT